MTGRQLKLYRDSLGQSQRDIAGRLKEVSHATISRWEAEPDADIPEWATQGLIGETAIKLELPELSDLFDLSAREEKSFPDLLTDALREYIAKRKRNGVISDAVLPTAPQEGAHLTEAMKGQAEKNKQLIERSSAPPALRLEPAPQESATPKRQRKQS